ncbi:RNA-directed DNA polymerase, eukaryota, reverse transcriptase zinc-binding domain protein [Tanacetum coccineum]|uniref:RNA-directed DNA polymerase, eukaryota, reverse transcriptase zinc-binding domain protein n=1 Tax=Tanacetum coccineum TaxID=301880 RepID=A0ABQ5I8J3_9ASTR
MKEGCRMFKDVKSLKGLKKHLKQLAWRNGDIFEKVKKLRDSVKEIQMKIDKDPNNHELRCKEAEILKLYSEAMKDEEKILFQKSKRKDVTDQFVKHFQQFLGESRHVEQISDMDSLFQYKLNSTEAEYMVWESCGHFKGDRRLRQGDPISPYLFTLVMEILTLIIKRKVDQSRDFQYHFRCKKLKITNVCFVDDLLMFCHADKSSVSVLKDSIDEFRKVTRLIPNYNKSTIIFGCLNDEERKELLDILPFKVESLPIKYLGVPLTSKRLRAKECKSLLDKVENRVSNWKNKCLSYAGSKMMVPKEELKWLGKMSANLIKRVVWEVKVDSNDSWGWKNILNQRKDVKKFIFSKLGDGNRTSVCFDNWSNIGTLDQVINHRALYDARLSARLIVKDLIGQSN